MRVLITGVAGFLGENLAKHHLQRGDEVFGIDNFIAKNSHQLDHLRKHSKFQFIQADICHWSDQENLLSSIDIIYHFAAIVGVMRVIEYPELVLKDNIQSCNHLLEKIRLHAPNARIFLASSSEVYGHQKTKILNEELDACIPIHLKTRINYPVTKLVMECFGLTYFETYGLNITILRIFNTIGPGQVGYYGMVVPKFIQAAQKGQNLEVYEDGSQSRCFCDVRDLIGYLDALINCEASIGKIINVGNDKPTTILHLAQKVIELSKSKSKITFIPFEKIYHQAHEFVEHRQPDLSLLHSLVSYRSQWRLEDTLRYLIKHEN